MFRGRGLVRLAGALAILLVLVVVPINAALAAPAPSAPEAQGQTTYVVRWGDTLYKISQRFAVSIQAIRDANGIVGNRIYAGQRLIIPGPSGNRASMTITPASGQPGSRVRFSATGFPPNADVNVWMGPSATEATFKFPSRTLPNGTLNGELVAEGMQGTRIYIGITTPDGSSAASRPFNITSGTGGVLETEVPYVMALDNVNIRSGPGTNYRIIGKVFSGQIAKVTGVSVNYNWWRVICPNGSVGSCWVTAQPDLTQPHSGL